MPLKLQLRMAQTLKSVELFNVCTILNFGNKHGSLPIHYACRRGHLDAVKLLISKGTDFTSTDDDGDTPLHLASQNRDTSIVDYLIQPGAQVNCRNNNSYLLIHYACLHRVRVRVRVG